MEMHFIHQTLLHRQANKTNYTSTLFCVMLVYGNFSNLQSKQMYKSILPVLIEKHTDFSFYCSNSLVQWCLCRSFYCTQNCCAPPHFVNAFWSL